ncbi:MAG: TRAP transporter large permease [Pseudomonadota bacterium]
MSLPIWLMLAVFFGGAVLRVPIGLAMLAGGIAYLFASGQDVGLAGEQILNGLYNSYVLMAVPLFIFAANVMNAGTISDRLFDFAHAIMGRFRGGLAHVDVLVSVIFAGMSGSAIADAAGPGLVTIRMMTANRRYKPGFAAAITAASATIGPIIPPSIPMVLYALVSDTSIGALFLGGVGPGLLMAAFLMGGIVVIAHRRGFPAEATAPWREWPRIFFRGSLPLTIPIVLLGGIYSGVFTPTEAAAVAAFYALVLSTLLYRAVAFADFLAVLSGSLRSSAVVTLIIAGAFVMNYAVATEQLPGALAAWLAGFEMSPLAFMLAINLVFLLLGCFLDTTTMLLVLVPLLLPAVKALGIDLVYFGVVIIVNMMIGLITPPYGVLLFVINALTGIPLKDMIAEIWPFVVLLVLALAVMVYVPGVVLWLPGQLGYGPK